MTEKDLFRRDLYYRLAVLQVEVPSLNRRRDDIVPIAKHFLTEIGKKHGKTFRGFASETEDLLRNYRWRGNIRELRNCVERGVLIGEESVLTTEDLGLVAGKQDVTAIPTQPYDGTPPLPDEGINLQALEEHYIKEALRKAGGNETKAAKLLGMSYYSFRYRRKKIKDLQA
jgi:DNA-binding NtrC family response regulator